MPAVSLSLAWTMTTLVFLALSHSWNEIGHLNKTS